VAKTTPSPRTEQGARKNPLFGQFNISDRLPASRTSYCRAVFFHYLKQNFGRSSNLRAKFDPKTVLKTDRFIVEEEILSCRISKSLDSPSATFNLSLTPTQNWKQKISPGDWVAIYFFNGSEANIPITTRNIVMLGNVDRISRNLERNEDDDKIELRYDVSGRNFGKVFEDLNIWYDPYAIQDSIVDISISTAGIELTGNPSKQCNQILDVFLGPGANFGKEKTGALGQWQIPVEVSKLFDLRSFEEGPRSFVLNENQPVFYDIISRNIEPNLPGFRDRNVISAEDNGNLWENLQRSSNDIVNELFLELVRASDGTARPTVVLRPRPLNTPFFDDQFFKEKDVKKALNGKFKTFQDFSDESFIEISQAEITSENLGRDDHSRFNLYWLVSNRDIQYNQSIYAHVRKDGRIGNPFAIAESINRYGLKKMHRQFDFDRATNKSVGTEPNRETNLWKAFMVQLYDQNFANHLYEAGTIETSGVLEAELGKALIILPDAGSKNPKKIFYIQGYEHEWSFPNMWKTVFTVTHGQFKTKDSNIFIDVGLGTDISDNGTIDSAFDSAYISKTETKNKEIKRDR